MFPLLRPGATRKCMKLRKWGSAGLEIVVTDD
jgi:hypothetical protein